MRETIWKGKKMSENARTSQLVEEKIQNPRTNASSKPNGIPIS